MSSGISPGFAGRGGVMLGFAESAAEEGRFFFYVRIPESIGPLVRGDRHEDPLQEALSAARLGKITGGGSQLGKGDSIAYCGPDVVVTDRACGWAVIRESMQRLGTPLTTAIKEDLPTYREYPLFVLDA